MMNEEVPIRFRNKDPLMVRNQVFVSSNVWDLTELELEKARVELGETEEKKRRFLQEMKDRLSKEGNYRLDDPFLLCFLRVRKYDCEKAYLNVKNYYNVRKKHPDLFSNPSNFSSSKCQSYGNILPYLDEEGRLILFGDVGCWNPREASFTECVQRLNGLCELYLTNPKCQVNGGIGIWNCKGISFRHMAQVLKSNLLAITSFINFTVPFRIKKIIFFNTGHLSRKFYILLRTMLTKKFSERLIILGSDMKELHQHVNPEILPKELGGKLDDDFCRGPNFLQDINIKYLEYDRSFTGAREDQ